MRITHLLTTTLAPLAAVLAIPAPKGGGGFGGGIGGRGGWSGGSSSSYLGGSHGNRAGGGGSYRGQSWTGPSFAAGAFSGYLGGIWVGGGPFRGGQDGHHLTEEPPPDCVVAKRLNKILKPTVDCFYTWEHWDWDNFLYYVIRISASGQETKGWADGIEDNIRLECGPKSIMSRLAGSDRLFHRNDKFGDARTVNGSSFYGIEMTLPLGQWTEAHDDRACVTAAIRTASCGARLNFTAGECYQKPGTQRAPWSPTPEMAVGLPAGPAFADSDGMPDDWENRGD